MSKTQREQNRRQPITSFSARERLSKPIYEAILSQILKGKLLEGDKLPTEAQLVRQFSVSRPVIREALAQLRDHGLVVGRRGSGSYVMQNPSPEVLKFAPLESIADMQRCFEFRLAIEPVAAGLAATRRDDSDLIAITNNLEALENARQTGVLGDYEDFAFHKSIAEASGNMFFATTLISLEEAATTAISVNRSLTRSTSGDRSIIDQSEHRLILKAIEKGGRSEADRAMRVHLESARRRFFEGDRVSIEKN